MIDNINSIGPIADSVDIVSKHIDNVDKVKENINSINNVSDNITTVTMPTSKNIITTQDSFIGSNIELKPNTNNISYGPITIDKDVTITLDNNTTWRIL